MFSDLGRLNDRVVRRSPAECRTKTLDRIHSGSSSAAAATLQLFVTATNVDSGLHRWLANHSARIESSPSSEPEAWVWSTRPWIHAWDEPPPSRFCPRGRSIRNANGASPRRRKRLLR